jgi:hypothetical protein
MKQISLGLVTALLTFAFGITLTRSLRTSPSAETVTISSLRLKYEINACREAVVRQNLLRIRTLTDQPAAGVKYQNDEAALRQNLLLMRGLIDQYTVEHGEHPRSLEDLVRAGYLTAIPIDPMTGQNSWQTEEVGCLSSGTWYSWGIVDVHSKSPNISSLGTLYSEW